MISDLRKQIARTVALVVLVLTFGRVKVDTSGQASEGVSDDPDQQGIGRLHRDERPGAPGAPPGRKPTPGAASGPRN